MTQNEEPNTKGDDDAKDNSDSREVMETIRNEVMRSGCDEILIVETRKSNKNEQPNNREPELEERELQRPERQFEEERRKRMQIEEKKKELEIKVERLKKKIAELNESSSYLKQEKEENRQVISELAKTVEEDVKKENDLLMEIEGLVDELVREEMLTQQKNSLDVNLNEVQ